MTDYSKLPNRILQWLWLFLAVVGLLIYWTHGKQTGDLALVGVCLAFAEINHLEIKLEDR